VTNLFDTMATPMPQLLSWSDSFAAPERPLRVLSAVRRSNPDGFVVSILPYGELILGSLRRY